MAQIIWRCAMLGAVGLLVAGGYWRFVREETSVNEQYSAASSPETPGPQNGAEAIVALVRVVPLKEGTVTEEIAVYGTVIPAPGAVQAISVPFESQVRQVFVSNGQRVATGEKLVEIDPSPDTQLQLEQARNAGAAAQQNLQYVQQRFTLKLATNDQLLQARQAMQDTRLRLESLEQRGIGSKRDLVAEVAGLISKVSVQEGAIVAAGSPLEPIRITIVVRCCHSERSEESRIRR